MQQAIMSSDFVRWIRTTKLFYTFILPAMCLSASFFVLEHINKRNEFADFRVYYDAATALRTDAQVYHKAFGVSSGFYKYAPLIAALFVPFSYLPYPLAAGIYFFLVASAIITFFLYVAFLLKGLLPDLNPSKNLLITLWLAILFGADHLERELHLGNVNMWLLLGCMVQIYWLSKNRERLAGVLLGLIILFKPHFVVLIPYFVVKRQWSMLFSSAAMLLLGMLVLIPWLGLDKNWVLHLEWFKTMSAHNTRLELSPNTLYGLINNGLFYGQSSSKLIIIVLLIIGGLYLLLLQILSRNSQLRELDFVEMALLLALIPSLTHTDTEHFMLSFPCVVYCIYMFWHHQVLKLKYLLMGLLLIAFVPFTINSPDIVGKSWRFFFDEGGGIGIANVLIIATTVIIKIQQPLSGRWLIGAD
jgi:Glycosyltransferase family 87